MKLLFKNASGHRVSTHDVDGDVLGLAGAGLAFEVEIPRKATPAERQQLATFLCDLNRANNVVDIGSK